MKLIALLLFVAFAGNAQDMQVNILGGAEVITSSTISISAGSSLTFRITNTRSNCGTLKIEDIILSNTADFSVSHNKLSYSVKSSSCRRGNKYLDFTVTNISGDCVASTDITIINNKDNPDFSFELVINSSPEIYVLGGNPWADIYHGSTTTSSANGTSFGVVDEGASVTRTFIVANIGSCGLDIESLASTNADFTVTSPYTIPFIDLSSNYYIVIDVTFTVDNSTPAGTNTAIISIGNNDNTTFTFTVSGEVFDYDIPGPGGVTADFRLWLKANRGVAVSSGSKLPNWNDVGTNSKNATQNDVDKQPTYYDDIAHNINFNPVVAFENDGSVEQYMNNIANGFYSQDMFIVMQPDPITPEINFSKLTTKNTIFAGNSSGLPGDITGVGFGNYTNRFTDEVITYAQNTESSFNGFAQTGSATYNNAGIINVRNETSPLVQELYFNSNLIASDFINDTAYTNVSNNTTGDTYGSPYWLAKNADTPGNFNGRIAEVFTFAATVSAQELEIIESYLAIKYGITLDVNGSSEEYFNSDNVEIWDPTANNGFNWNIAGIARDDASDLNQKQSKSGHDTNEVTIGLGGIFDTNSENPNEFSSDKQALIWGCNNGDFSGIETNEVTIATGITTSFTRIDRKWKIVESGGDVENVYVGIPTTVFSGFSKVANEEYVLIVADNANFGNSDIIDVIPLKINVDDTGTPILDKEGNQVYKTWYDFDGTKFFTFGKAAQLAGNHSINIGSGDYLVGESKLNLGVDAFTITAWIKSAPSAHIRTIMSKGTKLQVRLNESNQLEVWSDDDTGAKFTSTMQISDSKWHHISMIYDSGTLFVYIDGILDKSVRDIVHPSPNYNPYSIGALYISEHNVINPFLGEIDEVCVWDVGLTAEQLRYIMNQEVEKITGDLVSGKVLPMAASSNQIPSIPWSSLKVYYDFNSFYGSTTEGLTDARNFLRLNYLAKGKSIVNSQSAPLPYVSAAAGTWDSTSTWENGADIVLPNGLGLDGSTYIDWNIVNVMHDISSGDKDIKVLGLVIPENIKLTIADPIVTDPVELNDGQGLTVTHYLELDGIIDLVGESQFIQEEGSILDADSGGYIERDQQGTANSFNYNYWSSSVNTITPSGLTQSGTGVTSINTGASISEVLLDGTNSSSPLAISFNGSHTYADGSYTGAKKISTYWLYKFRGGSNDYNAWTAISENSALLPGEGFTMKGTSGSTAIATNQNYVFKGKPNNGDITLPISVGQDRLIGNPYPSAIDANEFILDNIKTSETFIDTNGDELEGRSAVNVFNGALYFWHHFGQENSHVLKEYVGGYATYTLMGGAMAYATDDLMNNTGAGGNKIPERYIPANQGFFVSAYLPSTLSGATATVDGGDIIFKNSQRVFVREGYTGTNDGSLFFKSNKKTTIAKSTNSDLRPKIRLKFNSPKGYHRQLLVGVDTNATNNFDLGYDAPLADVGGEDMFWNFSDAKFVIQAVNNFDNDQELALGLTTKMDGLVSIEIESIENINEGVEIFIKDKTTLRYYKINENPFEITLLKGEYLDRFSVVFKNKQVIVEESSIEEYVEATESTLIEGVQIYMNSTTSELQIKRNVDVIINEIQVFNSIGQLMGVWNKGFDEVEFSISLKKATGIYFIQINTNTGFINKKIINK